MWWNYEFNSPRLDFKTYPQSLWTLIKRKSFFKRFNGLQPGSDKQILYEKIMEEAQVELY